MKKILLVLLSLLIPATAFAAVFREDGNIPQTETILGNVYMAGGSPVVAGMVEGDLYMAGGSIVVTGNIVEDAVIAGGNVNITGAIGGDLRVFAGSITLDGRVDGEVMASGGEVTIGPNAIIRKDVILGGGNVKIHPNAQIFGSSKIMRGGDETRNGEYDMRPFFGWHMTNFLSGAFWLAKLWMLLSVLLVAAIAMGAFPNVVKRFVADATQKGAFWQNLGLGFLILIVVPIAAVLCIVTGIAAFLGILILIAYALYLMIACVFASILFGGYLKTWFTKKGKKSEFTWKWLVLGVVVLHALTLVPILGGFFMFAIFLTAMGATGALKWKIARAIK